MKSVLINESTYRRLFENSENEIYSSPDITFDGDKKRFSYFRDKDAVPFFLLPKNKIVLCDKRSKHNDFISSIISPKKRRKFINSIILQGRVWPSKNIISLWVMNSDNMSSVKFVASKLLDRNRDGFIVYMDKKYKVIYEDGSIWLKDVSEVNSYSDDEDFNSKYGKIESIFDNEMKFVDRNTRIETYCDGRITPRKLNEYELLCVTCYQVWADYLRTEEKFTTEDFKLFIEFYTKHRHSFDELFSYFHKNMRTKCKYNNGNGINSISTQEIGKTDSNDLILNLLDRLEIDDSEYNVIYYENSELPYSYNIKMIDEKEKFKLLVGNVRTSDKYIVDRISVRKIHNDSILTSCRIRLKPEFDNYWKN